MKTHFMIRFILVSSAILLAFCLGITHNDGNEDIISGKIDLSYQFRNKTMFYCDTIKVDSNNVPIDWYCPYYPKILTNPYKDKMKDFFYNSFFIGGVLRFFNEPILYNKELNKEVFRFVWNGSFDAPLVVRIEKKSEDYKLFWQLSKLKRDGYSRIVIVESKSINKKNWDDLIILINKANFWNFRSGGGGCGFDGGEWNLEGVDSKRYQIVARWSPDGSPKDSNIAICCRFLVNLTDLTDEQKDIY